MIFIYGNNIKENTSLPSCMCHQESQNKQIQISVFYCPGKSVTQSLCQWHDIANGHQNHRLIMHQILGLFAGHTAPQMNQPRLRLAYCANFPCPKVNEETLLRKTRL